MATKAFFRTGLYLSLFLACDSARFGYNAPSAPTVAALASGVAVNAESRSIISDLGSLRTSVLGAVSQDVLNTLRGQLVSLANRIKASTSPYASFIASNGSSSFATAVNNAVTQDPYTINTSATVQGYLISASAMETQKANFVSLIDAVLSTIFYVQDTAAPAPAAATSNTVMSSAQSVTPAAPMQTQAPAPTAPTSGTIVVGGRIVTQTQNSQTRLNTQMNSGVTGTNLTTRTGIRR